VSEPDIILPDGWPQPRGYTNAIAATGRVIALAGQVGWNPRTQKIESTDFVEQVRVALENIVAVLGAAGATAADVVRLTWFITDRDAYLQNTKRIGEAYRGVCGRHYPPMSVVIVAGLIEPGAKVEIEATAVVPE
jgi:enamine deaminase RidA (YjgF/YER057c/UK114 family)